MTVTIQPTRERKRFRNRLGRTQAIRLPKILCIDDEPVFTGRLEMFFRQFKVRFSTCFDGQQGIWEATTAKPDLILTDWAMPQTDGEEMVTTLRRNRMTETIPVIVISQMKSHRFQKRLFTMGIRDFIPKPIEYPKLFNAVQRFITLEPRNVTHSEIFFPGNEGE